MKLTKVQLRTLKFYQKFHAFPPTAWGLLWIAKIAWLPLLALLGFGVWMILTMPSSSASPGYIVVGMSLGAFFRDVGRAIASVRVWPAIDQVLDWERVSQLVNDNDKPAA